MTSEELSDPVECNDSANHATAIKNRDRHYNQFRLNFATQVSERASKRACVRACYCRFASCACGVCNHLSVFSVG